MECWAANEASTSKALSLRSFAFFGASCCDITTLLRLGSMPAHMKLKMSEARAFRYSCVSLCAAVYPDWFLASTLRHTRS